MDNLGYTIQSVVLDGKSGIEKAFKDIPRQMCHFHMRQIIKRYITMNPKLEAGKDLKKIMSSLTRTTEKNFTSNIAAWYKKHEKFLAEKTKSSTTGKLHYTHPKLRSAYRSLMKHTPYLFTYKNRKYKHLNIQNTTNSIEGGIFSHMKNMISLHRGITKGKKLVCVDSYLMKLGKK